MIASTLIAFLALAGLASSQESWVLDIKNQDTLRTVAFKNVTTPGRIQLLTWTWSGSKYENWQSKVVHHYTDDLIEGSLTYSKRAPAEKTHVLLLWRLFGDDFSSIKSNQKIFSNSWSIYTHDGIALDFNSNKEGTWELTVFNNYTITNNPDAGDQKEIPENVLRKRRSDSYEHETEIGITNHGDTTNILFMMDSISDFFGAGKLHHGRGEKLFHKMRNWITGMADRIRGGRTAVYGQRCTQTTSTSQITQTRTETKGKARINHHKRRSISTASGPHQLSK